MDKIEIWLGIFFVILLFFAVSFWMKNIYRLEEENQQVQMYISAMEDFYQEIKDKIDATRKYRHDLVKHIQMMEQILVTYQDGQDVSESVEKLRTEYHQVEDSEYCNHELINAICQIKEKECKIKKIRFQTEILSIPALPISEMDMVGLLQNLLDNAIEACERQNDSEKKEIFLKMKEINSRLEIHLYNTYDKSILLNFQTTKKNREEHGFGVRIIREIVNMDQGELQYISDDDYLIAYVVLPYHIDTGLS